MKRTALMILMAAVTVGWINAPASAIFGLFEDKKDKDAEKTNDVDAGEMDERQSKLLDEPLPAIPGPKRTVAVARFDATGAFVSRYSNWNVGGGLSAMLTSALVESDRFIVVERANLTPVLEEQELAANGLTNQQSGAKVGQLIGAQLLVMGSVTEFGMATEGGGFSIGVSGGSRNSPLGGGISPRTTKGYVAMDIRVVDSTTGTVVSSFTVKEQIKNTALAGNISSRHVTFGGDVFNRTPLGEACRRAINRAAHRFATEAAQVAWTGRVVDYDLGEVYLNAGENSNIKKGDRFKVLRVTKVLTDPTTGEVLGRRQKQIGTVTVTEVEEKLSIGKFEAALNVDPQRDDVLTQ